MRRIFPTSTFKYEKKQSGFSLIETLAALAISATTIIIIGSGLFLVLQEERAAVQTGRLSLVSRSLECTARIGGLKDAFDAEHADSWRVEIEETTSNDVGWKEWRLEPLQSGWRRASLFFIADD